MIIWNFLTTLYNSGSSFVIATTSLMRPFSSSPLGGRNSKVLLLIVVSEWTSLPCLVLVWTVIREPQLNCMALVSNLEINLVGRSVQKKIQKNIKSIADTRIPYEYLMKLLFSCQCTHSNMKFQKLYKKIKILQNQQEFPFSSSFVNFYFIFYFARKNQSRHENHKIHK